MDDTTETEELEPSCFLSEQYVLPCAVCGHIFTYSDNIHEHLISHMDQTTKNKTFEALLDLDTCIHTQTEDILIPCELSDKSNTTTKSLSDNRLIRTVDELYKYQICDSSFEYQYTDTNTKKKVSNSKSSTMVPMGSADLRHTTINLHDCKICHRHFHRFARLELHIRNFHPEVSFKILTKGKRKSLKFLNCAVESETRKMPIVAIKTPQNQSNYKDEVMAIDMEDLTLPIYVNKETASEIIKPLLPDKPPMPEKDIFMNDFFN